MQKTGWLIYTQTDANDNQSYIDWFIEEAALQQIDLKLIIRENLSIGILNNKRAVLLDGQPVPLPDFVIVRVLEPLLNLHFEALGVRSFNSAAVSQICNHKAMTHHTVHSLGIPMVDTFFFKKDQLGSTPPMSFPFVMKECTGRSGKQVYFIETEDDWNTALDALGTPDVVIQSCDVQLGRDVRVFIVGKEIIGAVLRKSTSDFRANFKLGGSAEVFPLDGKKTELIHKIIDHFDFGMVGIDFLIDHQGDFLFNEIEDVVGSRILSATTDTNILQKYIAYIKKCLA